MAFKKVMTENFLAQKYVWIFSFKLDKVYLANSLL
jgi:hypothetical protein